MLNSREWIKRLRWSSHPTDLKFRTQLVPFGSFNPPNSLMIEMTPSRAYMGMRTEHLCGPSAGEDVPYIILRQYIGTVYFAWSWIRVQSGSRWVYCVEPSPAQTHSVYFAAWLATSTSYLPLGMKGVSDFYPLSNPKPLIGEWIEDHWLLDKNLSWRLHPSVNPVPMPVQVLGN